MGNVCCQNVFCCCCSTTSSFAWGEVLSKFVAFQYFVLYTSQLWIYFGLSLFFIVIFDTVDDKSLYAPEFCRVLSSFVIALYAAKAIALYVCKTRSRTVYGIGILAFVATFVCTAFARSTDRTAVYTVGAPLLGVAIACMDTSVASVTVYQTPMHTKCFVISTNVVRLCAAVLACIYVFYVLPYVHWEYSFYVYALLSLGTLLYTLYFMPRKLHDVGQSLKGALSTPHRHQLYIILCIETIVSGIKWAIPFLLLQTTFTDTSPTTSRLIFSVFIAATCISAIFKCILSMTVSRRIWNIHTYAYVVAACVNLTVCFYYPTNVTSVSTWVLPVAVGLFGFNVMETEGIIFDRFGHNYSEDVSAFASLTGIAGAFLIMSVICQNTPETFPTAEPFPYYFMGVCNIVVLVLVTVMHIICDQDRVYKRAKHGSALLLTTDAI